MFVFFTGKLTCQLRGWRKEKLPTRWGSIGSDSYYLNKGGEGLPKPRNTVGKNNNPRFFRSCPFWVGLFMTFSGVKPSDLHLGDQFRSRLEELG